MKVTGNTVFITGGGTGIGRGLAAEFHKRGNTVIISGRRRDRLEETVKSFPGMQYVLLDVENPANIKEVAKRLIKEYPKLNVLINNAGVMQFDDLSAEVDEKTLTSTITTNILAGTDSRYIRTCRTSETTGTQLYPERIVRAGIHAACSYRNLLFNQGRSPFIQSVPALQTQEFIGEGARSYSTLGANRSFEQQ